MSSNGISTKFIYRRLTSSERAAYNESGYHCYGRILTDEGLAEMRQDCMAAWTSHKKSFDPAKTWLENALLVNIHHMAPIVRDFYFDGPLVDIAEQLIGPNIKGATSQLTFKMRGNTKPFGWHQDNGYGELEPYNAISCLTALDDTDTSNGCLWVIPGSNRAGQSNHKVAHETSDAKHKNALEVRVDESKAIPISMKAGECLFFNCWTLHKSDGNLSDRDRRILFLRYADADAVEVYNDRRPRLGRVLRGCSRYEEVSTFEAGL